MPSRRVTIRETAVVHVQVCVSPLGSDVAGEEADRPATVAYRNSPLDVCLRTFRIARASGGRSLEQCALGAKFRDLRSSLLELLARVVELLSQIDLASEGERELGSLLKGSVHRGWLWLPGAACAERTNPIGIAAPLATPTSDARNRHDAHCNETKRYVQRLVQVCEVILGRMQSPRSGGVGCWVGEHRRGGPPLMAQR